jgi:2-polyprenyl-3-methyl-5-hydroxy-6-metoxy-1,4-benzoquinol methylase
MSGWNAGYVTDVAYTAGFYSSQSQSITALAALLNGIAARPVCRDEPFHFADIGCGQGVTALIIAAANPAWRVSGLDFQPGHIAAAREMARNAGLDNVTFLEADLRDFAETPECRALDAFDAVSAHGVWSWVDDNVQDGIIRLLNARLKPGGAFQLSYNTITGWQTALGLQRLIREAGIRSAARSDAQAAAGLKIAQTLAASGTVSYATGFGRTMLDKMAEMPAAYIAHEFMNAHWRPVMHADVAARLAAAKLDFAGSSRLLTNFPQLILSQEQRDILAPFDDPAMLELFKDICQPQALRTDVFIRGPRRIDALDRDARLSDIVIGLTAHPSSWKFEFEAAGGMAQMTETFYRPIFERLHEKGPASLHDLFALPSSRGRARNPAELLGIMLGTEQAVVIPNPVAKLDERAKRLNAVLLRAQFAAGQGAGPIHFAVPATGNGLTLPNFDGMILHEIINNPNEMLSDMAARLAIHQNAEQRAALTEKLRHFFTEDAPFLAHFGLQA